MRIKAMRIKAMRIKAMRIKALGLFLLFFVASSLYADSYSYPSDEYHDNYYNEYNQAATSRYYDEFESNTSAKYQASRDDYYDDDDGEESNANFDDSEAARIKRETLNINNELSIRLTNKIFYKTPRIVIKAIYPTLNSQISEDDVGDFNRRILEVVDDESNQFETAIVNFRKSTTDFPKKMANKLFIDYAASYVKSKKNNLISIRFTIHGTIAGMRKPYNATHVLNYNLETQELVQLDELFNPNSNYLELLSAYSRDSLRRRMGDSQLNAAGIQAKSENFKNWNIKANGLLITFDADTVAPSSQGMQIVTIPFSKLRDIIPKDSIIGSCVYNPKTCGRNGALSGGFIDEAKNFVRKLMYAHA